MMTSDKLADLYKVVLRQEELLEIAKDRLDHISRDNRTEYDNARKQVNVAKDNLAAAQKVFSAGITSYNKSHRNIPFYRKSKIYTVKLKNKTVRFYFDQRGIPTIT